MGSIISSPKAPAPIYIAPPEPVKEDTAALEAEALRARQIAAKQRGLSSNIATSDRGMLQTNSLVPPRKSLLGE